MRSISILIVAVCTALAYAGPAVPLAGAQAAVFEDQVLERPGGGATSQFGYTVKASGDRFLVGASRADGPTSSCGEVHVFRAGPTPVHEALLSAADLGTFDLFGVSAAFDGDVIAVAAPRHDQGGTDAGAVYLYRFDGASWNLEQKLQADPPEANARFGSAVALSGDVLAVGEPVATIGGTPGRGRVHVYHYAAGLWSRVFTATGENDLANDSMGYSLALDGEVLAVGARHSVQLGEGAVYVFRRLSGSWSQEQILWPSSLSPAAEFGYGIALQGDLLAVGDPDAGPTSAGRVHLFRYDGVSWSHEDVLDPTYGTGFDYFGSAVEVIGNRMLVGAAYEAIWGEYSGAVHTFELIAGAWEPRLRLVPSTFTIPFHFGEWNALLGDQALVGYPIDSAIGGPSVRIYDLRSLVGTRFCAGDGTGTPCPCGNESDPALGNGCENKHGQGATLDGTGSASVAADDLSLSVTFTMSTQTFPPKGEAILLFAGDARINGGLGLPLGDGLRCVGGNVRRLGVRFGTPYRGIGIWGPGLAAQLGVGAGDTRYFHAWYRDPIGSPCGSSFNTTNALELVFEP